MSEKQQQQTRSQLYPTSSSLVKNLQLSGFQSGTPAPSHLQRQNESQTNPKILQVVPRRAKITVPASDFVASMPYSVAPDEYVSTEENKKKPLKKTRKRPKEMMGQAQHTQTKPYEQFIREVTQNSNSSIEQMPRTARKTQIPPFSALTTQKKVQVPETSLISNHFNKRFFEKNQEKQLEKLKDKGVKKPVLPHHTTNKSGDFTTNINHPLLSTKATAQQQLKVLVQQSEAKGSMSNRSLTGQTKQKSTPSQDYYKQDSRQEPRLTISLTRPSRKLSVYKTPKDNSMIGVSAKPQKREAINEVYKNIQIVGQGTSGQIKPKRRRNNVQQDMPVVQASGATSAKKLPSTIDDGVNIIGLHFYQQQPHVPFQGDQTAGHDSTPSFSSSQGPQASKISPYDTVRQARKGAFQDVKLSGDAASGQVMRRRLSSKSPHPQPMHPSKHMHKNNPLLTKQRVNSALNKKFDVSRPAEGKDLAASTPTEAFSQNMLTDMQIYGQGRDESDQSVDMKRGSSQRVFAFRESSVDNRKEISNSASSSKMHQKSKMKALHQQMHRKVTPTTVVSHGQIIFSGPSTSKEPLLTIPRKKQDARAKDPLRRSLPLKPKILIDQRNISQMNAGDQQDYIENLMESPGLRPYLRKDSGEADHCDSSQEGAHVTDDEENRVFSSSQVSHTHMPTSLLNRQHRVRNFDQDSMFGQLTGDDLKASRKHTTNEIVEKSSERAGKNETSKPNFSIFEGNLLNTFFGRSRTRTIVEPHSIISKQDETFTTNKASKATLSFESPRQNAANRPLKTHTFKCNCAPSPEPFACERAYRWLQLASGGVQFDAVKNHQLYQGLLHTEAISTSEQQIKLDISRTFPHLKDFEQKMGEGQQTLKRVLCAFSRYDNAIGYVQGMNFIVGSLLFHCSEEAAFWLFVSLIEDYEMRDIFQPDLPGLYKHSQMMEQLLEQQLPELLEHMTDIGIRFEMYASDWVFALYANIIPTSQMQFFFDNFFQSGWCFFYKMTLTLLRIMQSKIMNTEEIDIVLDTIKLAAQRKNLNRPHGESVNNNILQASSASLQQLLEEQRDSEMDIIEEVAYEEKSTFFNNLNNFFFKKSHKMKREEKEYKIRGVHLDELDLEIFQEHDEGAEVENSIWQEVIALSHEMWAKRLPNQEIISLLHEYDKEKLQRMQQQFAAQSVQMESEEKLFKNSPRNNNKLEGSGEQIFGIVRQHQRMQQGQSPPSPHQMRLRRTNRLNNFTGEPAPQSFSYQTNLVQARAMEEKEMSSPRSVTHSSQSDDVSAGEFHVDVKDNTPPRSEMSPIKQVHESTVRGPYKKQKHLQAQQNYISNSQHVKLLENMDIIATPYHLQQKPSAFSPRI